MAHPFTTPPLLVLLPLKVTFFRLNFWNGNFVRRLDCIEGVVHAIPVLILGDIHPQVIIYTEVTNKRRSRVSGFFFLLVLNFSDRADQCKTTIKPVWNSILFLSDQDNGLGVFKIIKYQNNLNSIVFLTLINIILLPSADFLLLHISTFPRQSLKGDTANFTYMAYFVGRR